ncbi:hypothetical protein H5410_053926 [Solanum commersonii]|uniref:Uncharacterized protein n=1 Tax=Solanum commersonii TaxID=4109 RepID=A0A9J5X569_SOLCO|nr:hypothetical protein H5410_053926 [Solanum commersonii]
MADLMGLGRVFKKQTQNWRDGSPYLHYNNSLCSSSHLNLPLLHKLLHSLLRYPPGSATITLP